MPVEPLSILQYWLEGYQVGESGREIKNQSLARAYLLGIEKRGKDERNQAELARNKTSSDVVRVRSKSIRKLV